MIQIAVPDLAWYLPSGLEAVLLRQASTAPIGAGVAAAGLAAYAAMSVAAGGVSLARRDVA